MHPQANPLKSSPRRQLRTALAPESSRFKLPKNDVTWTTGKQKEQMGFNSDMDCHHFENSLKMSKLKVESMNCDSTSVPSLIPIGVHLQCEVSLVCSFESLDRWNLQMHHPKNHGISKLVGTGDPKEPCYYTESFTPLFRRVQSLILRALKIQFTILTIWVLPKIVVPPNHPF